MFNIPNILIISIAILVSYLVGSLSTAIMTCKWAGLPDPRTQGSGNPGTTNVLRYGGKKVAIVTLLGDIAKGAIPVLLAKAYGFNSINLALIAFAAFIGHIYPIFFRFKGGKGVATALGCWLGLCWPVGLLLLLTWLLVALVSRYSSLAALITALAAPLYAGYFTNSSLTVMTLIMSILLIYKHKKNIKDLIHGKERQLSI